MGDIGELGAQREAADDTFGYFGARLRVHPDTTDIAIIETFNALGDIDNIKDGPTVLKVLHEIMAFLLHPEDDAEFWRLARANRQTAMDIGEVGKRLVEHFTGRPTQLPSASSDGQSSTATSFAGGSSSPAMELVAGRPDLQLIILQTEEASTEAVAASA